MYLFVPSVEEAIRAHIAETAQSLIGVADYCYLSEVCRPPRSVNCLMLVRYVYVESGVWAENPPDVSPSLLHEIRSRGQRVLFPQLADIVSIRQPDREYDHFGVRGFDNMIIHACWRRGVVVQDPLEDFVQSSVSPAEAFSLLGEVHIGDNPSRDSNLVPQTEAADSVRRSVS